VPLPVHFSTCKDCQWFDRGKCRFNPPEVRSGWPEVNPDHDWCKEFTSEDAYDDKVYGHTR